MGHIGTLQKLGYFILNDSSKPFSDKNGTIKRLDME